MPGAGLGVKVTPHVSTGNGMDFLVGRVSYTFGLQARPSPRRTLSFEVILQAARAHKATAYDLVL